MYDKTIDIRAHLIYLVRALGLESADPAAPGAGAITVG